MPADERRRRIDAIRTRVREHDLRWWIGAQLADLDSCTSRGARRPARLSPVARLRKKA